MNYKQDLQKEFITLFSEEILTFIFEKTDLDFLESSKEENKTERLYNQCF